MLTKLKCLPYELKPHQDQYIIVSVQFLKESIAVMVGILVSNVLSDNAEIVVLTACLLLFYSCS